MSRGKHWILTIWNNLDENEEKLREREGSPFIQATWQREKAPDTGRIHIQAYITFAKVERLSKLQQIFGLNNHFEIMRGTPEDARRYSSKLETREQPGGQWGELSGSRKGKRTDLEDVSTDIKAGKTFREICEKHTGVAIKYYGNLERVCSTLNEFQHEPNPEFVNRFWQTWINGKLEEQPDKRSIIWILDTKGGAGKTEWAREFFARNPDSTYLTGITKGDRQFYAYKGQRVVIFDICRAIMPDEGEKSQFPYQQLEHFKNGFFPAGMYGSQPKQFRIPHVVVLANWRPDFAKLSLDRWLIVELDGIDWTQPGEFRTRISRPNDIRTINFEPNDEGPSDQPLRRQRARIFLD